jgi:hypothetical protein
MPGYARDIPTTQSIAKGVSNSRSKVRSNSGLKGDLNTYKSISMTQSIARPSTSEREPEAKETIERRKDNRLRFFTERIATTISKNNPFSCGSSAHCGPEDLAGRHEPLIAVGDEVPALRASCDGAFTRKLWWRRKMTDEKTGEQLLDCHSCFCDKDWEKALPLGYRGHVFGTRAQTLKQPDWTNYPPPASSP